MVPKRQLLKTLSSCQANPVLVPGEHPKSVKMGVRTLDRQIMMPTAATIEGEGKGNGLPVLMHGLKAD